MRILIISNMYPSMNSPQFGIFVKEQVDQLKKLTTSIKLSVNTKQGGSKIEKILKYVLLYLKSLRLIFTEDIDIVHIHYAFPTGLLVFPIKWFTRKKVVITVHGSDAHIKSSVGHWILKRIFNNTDRIVTVSYYLKDSIVSDYEVNVKKVNTVNCGVNRELFYPRDNKELRQKYDIQMNKKVILFVGNLLVKKGIYTFVELMKIFPDKHDTMFIIVGNGPEREKIHKLTEGLASRVRIIGSVPKRDVSDWFNIADVFVLPSYNEGFGLVALESISCETPVIATRVGGIPEIIQDGVNGYLVNVNNANAISEKIDYLFTNNDILQRMIKASHKTVEENSIDLQVKKLFEIYKSVINNI
ncbi:glycosyltransferase [Radiobacillus kanasensis]|uniref:glycosyltransferase n=1 Tax=Radiobacillus kanasensis TaxID=2844358 RepID=UPI001E2E6431|nr:glycosyltransferase [Radiobacillus kanasensis]UFT98849.1 glycosyltransferase [Radiobacillus kanasensis]